MKTFEVYIYNEDEKVVEVKAEAFIANGSGVTFYINSVSMAYFPTHAYQYVKEKVV